MRDRTLILLGLLFLVSTVGAGVNQSLAAGNRVLGRQMAPAIDDMYRNQVPVIMDRVKFAAEYSREKELALRRHYPVLKLEIKTMQDRVEQRIVNAVMTLHNQWFVTFNRVKAKAVSEKNRINR